MCRDCLSKIATSGALTAIHRAKSIGAVDQSYQLDFVDLGLLSAVEGEIHAKLDRLLVEMLTASSDAQQG